MLILGTAIMLSGCFSLMRIPFEQYAEYKTDPVTGVEYKTNVVVGTCPNFPMCKYPTLHLRWHLLAFAWKDAPEGYKWRHVGGPCAAVVSLIGLPGDFLVDTCYLYHDWDAYKTASCPICDERATWDTETPMEKIRRIESSRRDKNEAVATP